MRLLSRLLVLCVLAFPILAQEYDDCDANFAAYIGSSAYQFSPGHPGELGTVRLFSILSYQRAAHEKRLGFALWQLRIERASDNARVLTLDGRSFIGREGAAVAELWWDGRDAQGQLVPGGTYHYTFVARYEPFGLPRIRQAMSYDSAFDAEEAHSSSDDVVVNYDLKASEAAALRVSANATNCQVQQHAPMEAGFAYNFYYGSTHSHSNWSDGGYPTSGCSSGNSYGSGTFAPADVFNFVRTQAGLDFWVVNEHNHLINDAVATNLPPTTEAKVRQRYADGLAAANAATIDGTFVAMYGMEWGVLTNADQGHVTLIETPKLFGWETCSTCNGPSAECTPGSNCYFDVFTPKRFGYLTLYATSVANPSSAGALGVLNHPDSTHFDNFAFNANADNALQGIAVRSGLAFTTATDCSTTNIGSTDYSTQFKSALNKGFHVGPVADHDSHCNNYGLALPTRTVYLAPSLTKASLMAAHRARHFFASEDPNAQLVFRTSDNAHIMGDIFNAPGGATLVANVYDPDGEATTTLEIWRGQIGGGVPSAPFATSASGSLSAVEPLTSGSYYYYVHAVQADGHDLWSAPMWITYQAGGSNDTVAPTTSITAPVNNATIEGTVSVTANASDNVGVTRVEFFVDGVLKSTDTTSPYSWSWNSSTVVNGTHTLTTKAYDAANNVGTSPAVSVKTKNDVTPPTVSITAPANNAALSGTVTVSATATDNVGVTKVEFYLDGALQSTDTTSPYSWSWNTTTAASGAHALVAKAYDASPNVGTSSTVNVTVSNGINIGGYKLVQANASVTYTIPAGTVISANGYVIIGRNATKAQFEAFWGVTLGTNVVYINTADTIPQINGSETYTLQNASSVTIDGPSIAQPSAAGQSIRRANGCGAPGSAGSWSAGATSLANPGSGAPAPCGKGLYISEFSDATGTGNFIYEFVEISNN